MVKILNQQQKKKISCKSELFLIYKTSQISLVFTHANYQNFQFFLQYKDWIDKIYVNTSLFPTPLESFVHTYNIIIIYMACIKYEAVCRLYTNITFYLRERVSSDSGIPADRVK